MRCPEKNKKKEQVDEGQQLSKGRQTVQGETEDRTLHTSLLKMLTTK
jgi:hypothetical protein